ncbi:hypothetical protein EN813_020875 [Mesorhizobium sp. M00.F.Ca.ET.170.01.1.1]|nr:hypothetical protein EN813_020875 [Mesorhizobium sp. M00.F.Ca.ET.170.01.1.1]
MTLGADTRTPRSFAPPSVLPDISPTRGEIRCRRWISPIANIVEERGAPKLPISPQVGEMSGRTEGGAVLPALVICQ